jgi:hypothetical protein
MICVMRVVNGKETIIPLSNQASYKEWNNCFSLLTKAAN